MKQDEKKRIEEKARELFYSNKDAFNAFIDGCYYEHGHLNTKNYWSPSKEGNQRLGVQASHIEWDKNNQPRLILTDQNNEEWSVSEENTVQGGFATKIVKKSECFFFKK